MTAWQTAEPRLTLSLGAACALFAAAAIWPWLPQGAAIAPRSAVDAGPSPTAAAALEPLPPVQRYAATVERPLFSPSRRPAPASAPTMPGSGLETRYRLLGLLTAGPERRALVMETAAARTLDLGEGEAIEGWRVEHIEQDRLVLSSSTGQAVMLLRQAAPTGTGGKP